MNFIKEFPTIFDSTIEEISPTKFEEDVEVSGPYYMTVDYEVPLMDIKYENHEVYHDVKEINELQNLFGEMSYQDFKKNRYKVNPFERIGETLIERPNDSPGSKYFEISNRFIVENETDEDYDYVTPYDKRKALKSRTFFVNRAALKMVNLDYLYGLTIDDDMTVVKKVITYSLWQPAIPGSLGIEKDDPNEDFRCADIASAPGGFTQYVQWRRPGAKSYMISLVDPNLQISQKVQAKNTQIILGPNKDGNIFTSYEDFIEKVGAESVDLSMADGAMKIEGEEEYVRKELTNSKLILVELYMGIMVLRKGRHMMCKIFSSVTRIMREILYLAFSCFEDFSILKPLTSRPGNSEMFLVLKNRRDGIDGVTSLMLDIIQNWENPMIPPSSILSEEINMDEYFGDVNDESMKMQKYFGDRMISGNPDKNIYDLNKVNALWSLPEYNYGEDVF